MKYNVVKGNEVVKKNLSKKQAEEYCDKMNKEFMEKQESIRKQQHNAGLPLRKSKYELYKVEVVKESKIVRLTESDLVRIVKKVINEDDGAFSFGDKIKSKLGSALLGIKPTSDEESKLADAILSKVESGDFSVKNSSEYSDDITYDFTVTLADGDYFCTVYKNIPPGSPTSTWYYGTKVKTPDGEKIHFNEKGFANKLIRLIKNSDKVSRYKFKG